MKSTLITREIMRSGDVQLCKTGNNLKHHFCPRAGWEFDQLKVQMSNAQGNSQRGVTVKRIEKFSLNFSISSFVIRVNLP